MKSLFILLAIVIWAVCAGYLLVTRKRPIRLVLLLGVASTVLAFIMPTARDGDSTPVPSAAFIAQASFEGSRALSDTVATASSPSAAEGVARGDGLACQSILRNGTAQTVVTLRRADAIYAVNGTARTLAVERGWVDGKTVFDPAELRTLLNKGLDICNKDAKRPASDVKATPERAKLPAPGPLTVPGLHQAVKTDDFATLQRYIDAKFNLETRGEGVPSLGIPGSTAVSLAAGAGKCEALTMLLKAGAAPDIKEKFGFSPLMLAAKAGAAACVQALLAKKVRIDIRNEPDGDTALILAAYEGHLDVVQLLVKAGASRSLANKDGDNALRAAQVAGNVSVSKYLQKP